MTTTALDAPALCVSVPDLVGLSALEAHEMLTASGLTGVYINKAGEPSGRAPLGRRVEAQFPMPKFLTPISGDVAVYTN